MYGDTQRSGYTADASREWRVMWRVDSEALVEIPSLVGEDDVGGRERVMFQGTISVQLLLLPTFLRCEMSLLA